MANTGKGYLPAAGRDWALPFYDPVVRLLGIDRTRKTLIEQAAIGETHRVLEIGCGTGSLLIRVKQEAPGASVVGLDPDPLALERARRKGEAAGVAIQLDRGFSDEMPYADASFDRVLSSFMFHHLSPEAKISTMREVRRVLRPGGSVHLVDFAGGGGRRGFLVRIFHSERALADHAEDRVTALMRDSGLIDPSRVGQEAFLLGHVLASYYRATVPLVA